VGLGREHRNPLGSGIAITTQTINALHDMLFKSADHRENIPNGNFREAGFGVASGDYKGSAAVAATEDLARSGTLPFLTGVAFDDRNGDHFYNPGEGLVPRVIDYAGNFRIDGSAPQ
jgi:serralysin